MKNKFCSFLILIFLFASVLYFTSCKNADHCPNPNEKVLLKSNLTYISYQGGESLKFLHNNLDTQYFIGQGKETYFITESASGEGECAKDYESIKVKFSNQLTTDNLEYRYERDKLLFGGGAHVNLYTGFKFLYKGKEYINEFYIASDSIIIGTTKYVNVALYGTDTNNYIARNPLGILRIRVNNENWDLIP